MELDVELCRAVGVGGVGLWGAECGGVGVGSVGDCGVCVGRQVCEGTLGGAVWAVWAVGSGCYCAPQAVRSPRGAGLGEADLGGRRFPGFPGSSKFLELGSCRPGGGSMRAPGRPRIPARTAAPGGQPGRLGRGRGSPWPRGR